MSDSKARKLLGVERVPHLRLRHPFFDLDWAGWKIRKARYEALDRAEREERARRAEEAKLQSGGA